MLLSTQDRQLLLPSGRIQTAGMLVGGVESAYAVGFDGSNDYIDLGSPSALQITGDITFSFWVKRNGSSDYEWVFVNEDSNGYPGVATILFNNGSGSKTIYFYRGNGSNAQGGVISASTIPVGVWTHIACTCSGTTYSIYINGLINNTATYSGMVTAKSQFVIGKRIAGTNGYYFPGVIDDIRIYNRALTADEISSIYNNTTSPPTSGLVFYLPLDEGTGTTVTDTIGGLTGTLTNGPTWQPQVCPRLKSNRDTTQSWGVSFDGVNYITMGNVLSRTKTDPWTLSAWVKISTTSGAGVTFARKQQLTPPSKGYGFGCDGSNQLTGYVYNGDEGYGGYVKYSTAVITPNVWTHCVVAFDGTGLNGMYLYQNGILQYTTSNLETDPGDITSTADFCIGNGSRACSIKDVRIYNSALSASDIAKLANNIPITATPVGHWKLDEGSGTTAIDSSGNGNNGTLTNGPTYSGDIPQWFRPTIESSHAASFDGTDDYVSITPITFGASTDWTVLAWINPSELRDWSGWAGEQFPGFTRLILGSNGAILVSSNDNALNATGPGIISANTWQCIAVQRSGDSVLYSKNGSAMQTLASGKLSKTYVYSAVGTGYYFFKGLIDELCIYNIALPYAVIADAAAGYLVRAGLVSRYKLDGNANDSHGTNHGTEQGGVGYSSNVPGTL